MKQRNKKSSNRPFQTILPLAKKLNIDIKLSYKRNAIKNLINYIKNNCDKNILICWQHESIPFIVEELIKLSNLKWGLNPESNKDYNDYTPIWIIENKIDKVLQLQKKIFSVYTEFEIIKKKSENIISYKNFTTDYFFRKECIKPEFIYPELCKIIK